MDRTVMAEYLWIDGSQPAQQVRSKSRVVSVPEYPRPVDLPVWSFDGSATGQARGDDSDCQLRPVRVFADPFRGGDHRLVLCEVDAADGRPHPSNQRTHLRRLLEILNAGEHPWLGFEQAYTLLRGDRPIGCADDGAPAIQPSAYGAAGTRRVRGRELAEAHAQACLHAGLMFHGMNPDAQPGQWAFRIGCRGIPGEQPDPLRVADELWVARYLLHRCSERFDLTVSPDPGPVPGAGTGPGLHTTFSTAFTRDPAHGIAAMRRIIDALKLEHPSHVRRYGDPRSQRQAGCQEHPEIAAFHCGVANRAASIRIPQAVAQQGGGYLEDRRPGANADPYQVAGCLLGVIARNPGRSHRAA